MLVLAPIGLRLSDFCYFAYDTGGGDEVAY